MGNTELSKDQIWILLVDNGIATYEEISLVTNINGYTYETLYDILFARTGYRTIEQLITEYE